jgi:hypothetical protein
MGVPSDRPTLHPSFDVEQYARDSDSRVAASAERAELPALPDPEEPRLETPQSEVRLATRPSLAAAVTDEAWAGATEGVPVVVMAPDLLRRLPLDHRAGYLLSLMDGMTDLETLVTIGPLPREEALRIVRELCECGVVDFRAG